MSSRHRIPVALLLLVLLAACTPAAPESTAVLSTAVPPTAAPTAVPPTAAPPTAVPTRLPSPTAVSPSPASTTPPAGLIAFVSVRDGNGEIYVMNADGSDPRRLTNYRQWDGFPDWSPDGKHIVYYSYLSDKHWVIKAMDADGRNPRQLTDSGACDGAPHWSPDGTRITYNSGDCGGDHREIYVIDAEGGTPVNLSNNPADDGAAAWSPDSAQLVFSSNRDGNYELYVMDADGGNVRRLTDDPADDHAPAWSPDGTRIAFYSDRDGNAEIYVMGADGSDPVNLTNHPANDWFPRWSPDSRQLTFSSWRDGNLEVYVMDTDGTNVRRLTNSPGEDFNSVWQPQPAAETRPTWIRSYEGAILGTVLDGVPVDGGYLFVGSIHYTHYNRDDEDLYLLRTDAAGEPLWEKTLGGDRFDRGYRVLAAAGGGFLILGETRSLGAGDRDLYLVKVDMAGEELWSQVYGGPREEQSGTIHATADGGYILSGQTASYGAGGVDVYLVKTDAQGNAEWTQTYGSELDDEGYAAIELPDGGFLVLGCVVHGSGDFMTMNPDVYLVRTDGQGQTVWSQVWEAPGAQSGFRLLPTSDGGFLISGLRSDAGTEAGTDALLLKVDADGNIIWDRAVGIANAFDYGTAVVETPDGGYLLTGMSTRGGQGGIPLTRLDGDGQVLWSKMLSEEPGNRAGLEILAASGGGYLVIGNASTGGRGWYTVLIKTDGEGDVEP
jgi:Tol biopolymer transport system component